MGILVEIVPPKDESQFIERVGIQKHTTQYGLLCHQIIRR
jgi:hypothetical protein